MTGSRSYASVAPKKKRIASLLEERRAAADLVQASPFFFLSVCFANRRFFLLSHSDYTLRADCFNVPKDTADNRTGVSELPCASRRCDLKCEP